MAGEGREFGRQAGRRWVWEDPLGQYNGFGFYFANENFKQRTDKSPTYQPSKIRTFQDGNTHSHVQSRQLVHVSGVHRHVCASSTVHKCAFVYRTGLYRVQQYSIFLKLISFLAVLGLRCCAGFL